MSAQGYYCSTSDTVFQDREGLQQHYQSELHKYNLKRKLAGLPPVTREWFEARKAQLLNQQIQEVERVWFCTLSRKKFSTENTYTAWTRSKKYQDLVKASGAPAPPPTVSIVSKSSDATAAARASGAETPSTSAAPAALKPAKKPAGFTAVPAVRDYVAEKTAQGVQVHKPRAERPAKEGAEDEDEEELLTDSEGWETASESDIAEYYKEKASAAAGSAAVEGEAAEAEAAEDEHPYGDPSSWPTWDPCRCLFCNQVAGDVSLSLEHMWKAHGFQVPDSEYVSDLGGLIAYLGLKIGVGHVPLYVRGDDANGKRFRSLHACQRHMVDTNQCRMVFEDNEDEYEDFYDYSALEEELKARSQLATIAGSGPDLGTGGYELLLPVGDKTVSIGHREFAQYYKQRVKLQDSRKSAMINQMNAKYRLLGLEISRRPDIDRAQRLVEKRNQRHSMRLRQKIDWMSAKIMDLPQYVPW